MAYVHTCNVPPRPSSPWVICTVSMTYCQSVVGPFVLLTCLVRCSYILKGQQHVSGSQALTGFEGLLCSRFQHLFSVGTMTENDSPKPRDVEAAGHRTNTYVQAIARSVCTCENVRSRGSIEGLFFILLSFSISVLYELHSWAVANTMWRGSGQPQYKRIPLS